MHEQLLRIIRQAKEYGPKKLVLAIPEQIDAHLAKALRDHPDVSGLVLTHPPPEITAHSTSMWLGYFPSRAEWVLPKSRGAIIFLGPVQLVSNSMILKLLLSGRVRLYNVVDGTVTFRNVVTMGIERLIRKCVSELRQLSPRNPLRIAIKYIVHRLASPDQVQRLYLLSHGLEPNKANIRNYAQIFERILLITEQQDQERRSRYIKSRVCHVNAGLAAGGAERQLVNTLHGLVDSKQCESVHFIAEYMRLGETIDFFADLLRCDAVKIRPMRPIHPLEETLTTYPVVLAKALSELPQPLLSEVMALCGDLEELQPEVVHAWQDATSIKVALAAHIVGVPKIVLAGRNVSPRHFPYITDYMADAYRCFAKSNRVRMINNSDAGATDYCDWLGLPAGEISVIRNGVDLSGLITADNAAIESYRSTNEIPEGAIVVGSIFRFWPEKRPLLWLEVANEVVRQWPSRPVYFLVVGDGPMRDQMSARAKYFGIADKVRFPGTTKAISVALSAMDCFLLTSQFEGTPNVLLEAQWLGIPVVTTDAGGTREAVSEGKTGEVIETESPVELAAAVVRQINHALGGPEAKQYGPQFIQERFGLQRMVRETIALYDFS